MTTVGAFAPVHRRPWRWVQPVVVLLIAVWYFALGPGAGPSTTTNNNDNTINPPAASQPAAPAGSSTP